VSGALEPEIETADAGEERRDAQTHRGDAASAAVWRTPVCFGGRVFV
jgi:hypothetical protein